MLITHHLKGTTNRIGEHDLLCWPVTTPVVKLRWLPSSIFPPFHFDPLPFPPLSRTFENQTDSLQERNTLWNEDPSKTECGPFYAAKHLYGSSLRVLHPGAKVNVWSDLVHQPYVANQVLEPPTRCQSQSVRSRSKNRHNPAQFNPTWPWISLKANQTIYLLILWHTRQGHHTVEYSLWKLQ